MSHEFRQNPQLVPRRHKPDAPQPMTDTSAPTWLDTPLGAAVLELETCVLAEALVDVFGFELVQLGCWGRGGEISTSARTQHRCWLAPDASGPGSIRAEFHALPIATGSVEAVLLPHTLEHAPHPHEMLREVERVLMGEGHVLICGFNPLGPWGLRHLVTRRRFPPSATRLMSEGRMRDWLELLGFEVVEVRRYLFAPPWTQHLSSRTRSWLEERGPQLVPWLAGAYLVKACKRVRTLTPIRPAWQKAPAVVGGLAEPTSRNAA
jgi:SAM-dependent methyltransferase